MNTVWQGSWEECLSVASPTRPSYKGQFCWQKLATPVTLIALNLTTFTPEMCNVEAFSYLLTQWSTCMPRSCTDDDITRLFQSLNSKIPGNGSTVTFCENTCRPYKPPKKDAGFWVMIAIFVIAGLLMLFGTTIDYVTDSPEGTYKTFRNNLGIRCLLTFSMYTNGNELLTVVKRPGQIESLHCIRVFSMTWVMAGHALMQFAMSDDLLVLMNSNRFFLNMAFTNAFFSVDSFLFLGGLLLTFLFLKDMDRRPANLKSGGYWFLYYIHRIVRLSAPYYILIGFSIVMYDFMTMGPLQPTFLTTIQGCRQHWWRNVLYINNLFDLEHQCIGHAWYLALDMQVHILAPLFLIPLAIHLIAGLISGVVLIAISTALSYWAYYKWDLEASYTGYFAQGDLDVSASYKYQQFIYYCSWVRFTPYIIGGWTAYFLFYMRKHKRKLRLHWAIAVALWVCSAAVAVACVYGLFDYMKGKKMSLIARSSYSNWSRIAWAITLAWVVTACEHGLAGPIKTFMEQGFWAPFSRLTYCAYLTHFFLISIINGMSRQPLHFSSITHEYISGALPVFVVSYAVAFVWSCAFEIPIMKLEKMATSAIFGGAARPRVRQTEEKPAEFAETGTKKSNDPWATNEAAYDRFKKLAETVPGERNGVNDRSYYDNVQYGVPQQIMQTASPNQDYPQVDGWGSPNDAFLRRRQDVEAERL